MLSRGCGVGPKPPKHLPAVAADVAWALISPQSTYLLLLLLYLLHRAGQVEHRLLLLSKAATDAQQVVLSGGEGGGSQGCGPWGGGMIGEIWQACR